MGQEVKWHLVAQPGLTPVAHSTAVSCSKASKMVEIEFFFWVTAFNKDLEKSSKLLSLEECTWLASM